jgi:two-component system response regulator PilR (NtrC family)
MRPLSILVVDDEKIQRDTLASILSDQQFSVVTAEDVATAAAALKASAVDVVLTDFKLPGGSGLDVVRKAAELCPESVSLIMTAYADVDSVIEAMRIGVLDYLIKPFNVEALLRRLQIISDRRALRAEVDFLREAINRRVDQGRLLGASAGMTEIKRLILQVAATRGTVLITGESGTGKEVVAREVHRASAQANKPFVAVNCGALPEQLLESELFGHKKGSFTGAVENKLGLFAVAHEGTLFLDEIGEMPKNLQVKLLRALQEREIVPVGDTKPVKVNLRVVAATNRDLGVEVAEGRFRQDLYYRINVVEIRMPPLRERPEDIPELARHFALKFTRELGKPPRVLGNEAARLLMRYAWPGNVRELENIIERAIILGGGDKIDVADLPLGFPGRDGPSPASAAAPDAAVLDLDEAVRLFSRAHVQRVLDALGGDKKETAKALGIGLSSLYRKLEELGLAPKKDEADGK